MLSGQLGEVESAVGFLPTYRALEAKAAAATIAAAYFSGSCFTLFQVEAGRLGARIIVESPFQGSTAGV